MNLRLMALNIREFVPDLSLPVIKQRINVRYKQILAAEKWEFLNAFVAYTQSTGTSLCTPATDCGEVISITSDVVITEKELEYLNRLDPDRTSTGATKHWCMYSKSTAVDGVVTVELWPLADQDYKLDIRYKKVISDMSADADTPLFRPEVLEAGALWDCYRLAFAITKNTAYIGLARDAKQDFESEVRRMVLEDMQTASMPHTVRDIMGVLDFDDNYRTNHDVEW